MKFYVKREILPFEVDGRPGKKMVWFSSNGQTGLFFCLQDRDKSIFPEFQEFMGGENDVSIYSGVITPELFQGSVKEISEADFDQGMRMVSKKMNDFCNYIAKTGSPTIAVQVPIKV